MSKCLLDRPLIARLSFTNCFHNIGLSSCFNGFDDQISQSIWASIVRSHPGAPLGGPGSLDLCPFQKFPVFSGLSIQIGRFHFLVASLSIEHRKGVLSKMFVPSPVPHCFLHL